MGKREIFNLSHSFARIIVLIALFVLPFQIYAQNWDIQTVDSEEGVGYYNSLALDSNDFPHISYFDNTNGNLKYARWTGSAWDIQIVDSVGEYGDNNSISIDSNDHPHISYYDYTNGDLKYARWTGSAWDILIVDPGGDVGAYNSIAIDGNDYPHISYFDETNGDLKYAKWTGSAWDIHTADSQGSVGHSSSLTLDDNDYPHISYIDFNTYFGENNWIVIETNLKYARWTGSAWDTHTVDSGRNAEGGSIALDSYDYPHISYNNNSDRLKYARWTGIQWDIQMVGSNGNVSARSLALDSNNNPHIIYSGEYSYYHSVKHARWTGKMWEIHPVDLAMDIISHPRFNCSIALDSSEYPQISYGYHPNSNLLYASLIDYEPSIALLYPNGGENYEAGLLRDIDWLSRGIKGDIKIDFSSDNGTSWIPIESSTDNDGSCDWTAPSIISTQCLVKISDIDGNPSDISDSTFTIYAQRTISLNKKYLAFGSVVRGETTVSQDFIISKSGIGNVTWGVYGDMDWMHCEPPFGENTGVVTVSVNSSGLPVGNYTGTVTVSVLPLLPGPGPYLPSQTVEVTLQVYPNGEDSIPFGYFDTPIQDVTVVSSVPVTGWVVDDIGIESLKIYRDPVSGEGTSLVYIGDAAFVEGARPDIEAAYPDYPLNYQTGWGYMMLTNFLPDQGNGTFVIYAYVTDSAGHEVLLGSKTITCTNSSAVKPFGAIDTPTQGGTASGSDYVNFGWALTPLPNSIPIDGSTINVFVDGVNLGHPVYNNYRSDIAALFPGYANSDGAVGVYTLDTTAYANGVHSIVWSVEDNVGNTDGIGSRYFSIFNGSSGETAQAQTAGRKVNFNQYISFDEVKFITPRFQPIQTKIGYNMEVLPTDIYPDENGIFNVEIKEVERLVIHLDPYSLRLNPEESYIGYTAANGQLRPLPIGSTLVPQTGIFSWQPGPGFIGAYDLIFIKEERNGELGKIKAKIHIVPKFTIR